MFDAPRNSGPLIEEEQNHRGEIARMNSGLSNRIEERSIKEEDVRVNVYSSFADKSNFQKFSRTGEEEDRQSSH